MSPARGHRRVPHTADLTVEAWGETRAACLEEAVEGLVASCVDRRGTGTRRERETVEVVVPRAEDEELLVALLEEVVFLLDGRGLVPVSVSVVEQGDGSLAACFAVVPVEDVEVVGAAPKAIARHRLRAGRRDGRFSCRFTVDV